MAYCHICETECVDITRHLFSCHTQPGATNPSTAAGVPNEIEPSEAEDEETFCYQCSREFQTAAALAAHLGDAQVHFRSTGNRANVPWGRSSYHATGLQVLRPRSSRPSENLDPNYEGNDASALPHDQSSVYTNSTHLSSEDSSDELASEDDESDDMPMETEYDVQAHTHTGAILGPPNPITGDVQTPHPAYTPGAYVFTSPSTVNPRGAHTYAPEGISQGQLVSMAKPRTHRTHLKPKAHPLQGVTASCAQSVSSQRKTLPVLCAGIYSVDRVSIRLSACARPAPYATVPPVELSGGRLLPSVPGTMLLPLVTLALAGACSAFQLKNLVTFGDSYTDNTMNGDAGYRWPDHVAFMSNGTVDVYDFAHSGATCSGKLTPRIYRPVLEAQVPEYFANVTVKPTPGKPRQNTTYIIGKNGTYVPLASEDTMYSIWIGTNDVGVGALLTDPLPDVSIVNTTECVFDWVQELYNKGARNFLIQNMTPMWLLPIYAPNGYDTKYWNSPHNQTEWSIFIAELVRAGNELQALRTKYIAPGRFPGARFGMFDSHRLFKDMYYNPQDYLVGPTYNVSGVIQACRYPYGNNTLVCETEPPAVRDSYLWWNELHPSEQAHKVVARNVLNSLSGKGPFVQWYGAK
ncbi:unnamed protein product [Rhizoctonia solani]|uniref:Uncharacterized protein n=2 Tax=Rhizoctonia solani TaxID=456999 RepID=A0A8H3AJG5_9AGAM|nr:unnamed protein product [Rhizoctonia solani]